MSGVCVCACLRLMQCVLLYELMRVLSGKSTAISMLLRFYNPDSGRVMIGGRDIKEYNIKSLRSQFGLVSQEPVLFAKSILENIRYGRDDATDEECKVAARRSNAEEFILTQPEQWHTNVGPRGSRLSGGQKQRFASWSLFESFFLVKEVSDCNDKERTTSLQAVLVVNMFASLVLRTRWITHARLEHSRKTTGLPLRGLCCEILKCCCWTRLPRHWTMKANAWCRLRWKSSWWAGPPSLSHIACPPFARRI
jgi:ABC-type iron transport system FetAB ATPase subunit